MLFTTHCRGIVDTGIDVTKQKKQEEKKIENEMETFLSEMQVIEDTNEGDEDEEEEEDMIDMATLMTYQQELAVLLQQSDRYISGGSEGGAKGVVGGGVHPSSSIRSNGRGAEDGDGEEEGEGEGLVQANKRPRVGDIGGGGVTSSSSSVRMSASASVIGDAVTSRGSSSASVSSSRLQVTGLRSDVELVLRKRREERNKQLQDIVDIEEGNRDNDNRSNNNNNNNNDDDDDDKEEDDDEEDDNGGAFDPLALMDWTQRSLH